MAGLSIPYRSRTTGDHTILEAVILMTKRCFYFQQLTVTMLLSSMLRTLRRDVMKLGGAAFPSTKDSPKPTTMQNTPRIWSLCGDLYRAKPKQNPSDSVSL